MGEGPFFLADASRWVCGNTKKIGTLTSILSRGSAGEEMELCRLCACRTGRLQATATTRRFDEIVASMFGGRS